MALGRRWVQLATRIPVELRRRAKLRAIATDVTLQEFVVLALEEKLARGDAAAARGGGAEVGPPARRAAAGDDVSSVPPPLLLLGVTLLGLLGFAATASAATVGLAGRAASCSAVWDTAAADVQSSAPGSGRLLCADGDPTCDADGVVDGACTIGVNACVQRAADGCAVEAVSRVTFSRAVRRLAGFVPPAVPAAEAACGEAGTVRLALRGPRRDRPSRAVVLRMRAATAQGRGRSTLRVQCVAPSAAAQCPEYPVAGQPRQLSFVVPAGGSDLDNGWTGISHNFPVPQGARLELCLAGCDAASDPACEARGETGRGTPNGETFGPPLPLLAAGVPVCVVNRFDGPVDARVDLATGAIDGTLRLRSAVHALTPGGLVCPRCENGLAAADAIGSQGRCAGGATPGAVCTVEGVMTVTGSAGNPTYKLSSQCLPAGSPTGTLSLAMPITTATSRLDGPLPCTGPGAVAERDDACGAGTCDAACTGGACVALVDGECVDTKGGRSQACCSTDTTRSCFPTASGAGAVVRTGRPFAAEPGWPDPSYPKTASAPAALAATFCEPATGDATVDMLTGLPGPGALLLPGQVRITAQD